MSRAFMLMEEAAPYIAKVIQPIVANYGPAPDEVKKYYKNVLKWAIRDLERFVKPVASKAAIEQAASMGIGDLTGFIWNEQTTKMADAKRKIFHWEHVSPVSDLVDECLSLENPDHYKLISIISKVRIAWILKSEDQQLKKYSRGVDPLRAYQEAGIELWV